MLRIIAVVLLCLSTTNLLWSQKKIEEKVNIPMFSASYATQFPLNDLSDRFGWNSNIGGDFQFKTKQGWIFGVEGYFMFGNQIKEDSILDGLRTSTGDILNENGEYGNILSHERGYYVGGKFGKVFSLSSGNPNSGIIVTVSAGLLEHKIKIENQGNTVPQLVGDYKKGYDRLTNGLALREFIGYMYIGENQYTNFFAGFEFYQSWTMNRRSLNYDTMQQDTKERRDDLVGFRVGWIIPLYRHIPDGYYTN